MPKAKRHHFVPRFLIRNFCNTDGYVWYYDRTRPLKSVEQRTPEGVHWKRHIYSVRRPDDSYQPVLEAAYQNAETGWADLIDRILEIVRMGRLPRLDSAARHALSDFFVHQHLRVPDFWTSIPTANLSPSELREEMLSRAFEEGGKEEVARIKSYEFTDRELLDIQYNARIKALSFSNQPLIDILNRKDLFFAISKNSKKSFVLGSSAVTSWGGDDGSYFLPDRQAGVALPLSQDVLMGFAGDGGQIHKIDIEDESSIRSFNEIVWKQSSAICARDKRLVESVTRDSRKLI
tara:strand:+ start:222 stop:1094 length:873 start_codon:yes stop_codon:yes gene_type:complete